MTSFGDYMKPTSNASPDLLVSQLQAWREGILAELRQDLLQGVTNTMLMEIRSALQGFGVEVNVPQPQLHATIAAPPPAENNIEVNVPELEVEIAIPGLEQVQSTLAGIGAQLASVDHHLMMLCDLLCKPVTKTVQREMNRIVSITESR